MNDLSMGKWGQSGQVEDGPRLHYMEFVPTIVRVSDVYVSDMLSTKRGLCLRALQHLFLGYCS